MEPIIHKQALHYPLGQMSHEKELDQLRRDAENKVCPNCLKEDKMGFDAVCWAFKTFVCSTCKSSHQAFSHRCKSVRMSNWTRAEVDALKPDNGGGRLAWRRMPLPRFLSIALAPCPRGPGNAACRAKWLGNLESRGGRRPRPGDEEKIFKQFIDQAYNNRAFFCEEGARSREILFSPAGSHPPRVLVGIFAGRPVPAQVQPDQGQVPVAKAQSAPPPAVDDLFGSFEAATGPVPTTAASGLASSVAFQAAPSPPPPAFDTDFGAFASAPPTAQQTNAGNEFMAFESASSASPSPMASLIPPPAAPGPTASGMATPPRLEPMGPAMSAVDTTAKKDAIMSAFQANGNGAASGAASAANAPLPLDPSLFGGHPQRMPVPPPMMHGPGSFGSAGNYGMPMGAGMGPVPMGRAHSFPTHMHGAPPGMGMPPMMGQMPNAMGPGMNGFAPQAQGAMPRPPLAPGMPPRNF